MIYMHKNCLDVAFKAYTMREYKRGFVNLKGVWINLGYDGSPWECSESTKLRISKHDFIHNWVNVSSKIGIPRQAPGLPK